jgi:fatty-acyl-CoA synthase
MLLADLESHAVERGAKPCLVHWDHGSYNVLTFAQFATISDGLAAAVRRQAKTESSGAVLILLKHHVLQLPLFVACMKAGLVPCFLPFPSMKQDPALYWTTHSEVVARSRPALIVTYQELVDGVTTIARDTDVPVSDIAALTGEAGACPHPKDTAVALLQHSSGTTGLKKGVALTYGQIARQVSSYSKVAGLTDASVVASWLPYYHDMGLFTAFLIPLSIGATTVSMDAFEWVQQPDLLLHLVQRFRGTHCWLPNFAFSHILNATPSDRTYDLDSLQFLVSCSEPVRAATLDAFLDRFQPMGIHPSNVKACYAMAETCFAVSQTPTEERYDVTWYDAEQITLHGRAVRRARGAAGARPYVSNGAVIDGIDVRILPDLSMPSPCEPPVGVPVGEIAVRGGFVFEEYFADDEATRAAFEGDWYKTGDIGFVDDGQIYVSGRRKELLIVHGRNYYAHDIEAAAGSVDAIIPGRVVAIGVVDESVGSEEAIILAETDAPVDEHFAMRREVKRKVYGALELTPKRVDFLPRGSLVKTTSGKISRSENLRRFLAAEAR